LEFHPVGENESTAAMATNSTANETNGDMNSIFFKNQISSICVSLPLMLLGKIEYANGWMNQRCG
jgi:hypothetical protein